MGKAMAMNPPKTQLSHSHFFKRTKQKAKSKAVGFITIFIFNFYLLYDMPNPMLLFLRTMFLLLRTV